MRCNFVYYKTTLIIFSFISFNIRVTFHYLTKLQLNTVKNILRNTNCVKEFISVSTNCAHVMENHFIYKVQIHNSFIKAHFDAAILAVTVLKSVAALSKNLLIASPTNFHRYYVINNPTPCPDSDSWLPKTRSYHTHQSWTH